MTEFKDIHGRAITVAILFVCLFAGNVFGDQMFESNKDKTVWADENTIPKSDRFEPAYYQDGGYGVEQITILIDTKTGVKYLFVEGYKAGGLTKLEEN